MLFWNIFRPEMIANFHTHGHQTFTGSLSRVLKTKKIKVAFLLWTSYGVYAIIIQLITYVKGFAFFPFYQQKQKT